MQPGRWCDRPRRLNRVRSRSLVPRQPARDRSLGPAQLARRVFLSLALEIAENHRDAIRVAEGDRAPRRVPNEARRPRCRSPRKDSRSSSRACASGCSLRRRRCPAPVGDILAATPCSQGPRESRLRIVPALSARARNVAWKASSAVCSSRTTRRQTPSTIGPCRPTITSKARRPTGVCPRREVTEQLSIGQAADRARSIQDVEVANE